MRVERRSLSIAHAEDLLQRGDRLRQLTLRIVVHEHVAGAGVLLDLVHDSCLGQRGLDPRAAVTYGAVVAAVARDHRARADEELASVLRNAAVVDTRRGVVRVGREQQRVRTAHAEADDADFVRAAVLGCEPGPGGFDLLELTTFARTDGLETGLQTCPLLVPAEQVGRDREVALLGEPVGVVLHRGSEPERVVNHHHSGPRPGCRRCCEVGGERSVRSLDHDIIHGWKGNTPALPDQSSRQRLGLRPCPLIYCLLVTHV